MKYFYFTLFLILPNIILAQSQPNYSQDNGTIGGSYVDLPNYEETCFLQPKAPGKLKTIFVHLAGSQARVDTIRIVGDPSDGFLPGSWWVSGFMRYNLYGEAIINYNGTPNWFPIDVSSLNLDIGGINRIGICHVIKPGGPFFSVDSDGLQFSNSNWLNNVYLPNKDFYNIAGTIISRTSGDYMVRAEIDWTFPEGQDATAPSPTLIDITQEIGLLNSEGNLFGANEASIVDFDDDGNMDIISSQIFRNTGESFKNVTSEFPFNGRTVWGDLDNDGNLDVYKATGNAEDAIWWGTSTSYSSFEEETDIDIQIDQPTMTPLFLDYDKDGDLDIFVAYNRKTINGKEVYYQDQLFRNDGNRQFSNVTTESKIALGEPAPYMDCYGANVVDYNKDGYPDIFVATYRLAPDLLYENQGNGTFLEVGEKTGVIGTETYSAGYYGHGMGSDWSDFDNDGDLDLIVGNLGHPDSRGAASNPSQLFINNNGKFTESQRAYGVKFFEMNSGATWIDINNDGLLDLIQSQYSYEKKGSANDKFSRLYLNKGNNKPFDDKTWEYGFLNHGAWTSYPIDFDNDGDMDILSCSSKENVKLFENIIDEQGSYVNINLSPADGKTKYGSEVEVTTNLATHYKQLPGTKNVGRTGQKSDLLHFGLGNATQILSVKIKYPNKQTVEHKNLELNKTYTFDVLSIKENNQLISNINLYPNPANQNTNLILEMKQPEKTKIELIDLKGTSIQTIFNGYLSKGTNLFNINLSNILNGTYIIKIDGTSTYKTTKLNITK